MGAVYLIMNGPSEFHVTGTIKDWDRTDRLSEIHVPTLIISGEYDEATPIINELMHKGIPGSEWVMLENCSHIANAEDPEHYMQLVQNFLQRVEEEA
jgi:proline-specific peptidase